MVDPLEIRGTAYTVVIEKRVKSSPSYLNSMKSAEEWIGASPSKCKKEGEKDLK
jgi:hypothetical protein